MDMTRFVIEEENGWLQCNAIEKKVRVSYDMHTNNNGTQAVANKQVKAKNAGEKNEHAFEVFFLRYVIERARYIESVVDSVAGRSKSTVVYIYTWTFQCSTSHPQDF
jgi:hypothetical protein